jgi:hypothetical protein
MLRGYIDQPWLRPSKAPFRVSAGWRARAPAHRLQGEFDGWTGAGGGFMAGLANRVADPSFAAHAIFARGRRLGDGAHVREDRSTGSGAPPVPPRDSFRMTEDVRAGARGRQLSAPRRAGAPIRGSIVLTVLRSTFILRFHRIREQWQLSCTIAAPSPTNLTSYLLHTFPR